MTLVPCVYVPEQVPVFPVEQLMPDGDVTEPLPLTVVVSANDGSANEAVTDLLLFSVTLHAPVPVHAPLHPASTYPVPGVAAKLTTVPEL